MHGETVKLI